MLLAQQNDPLIEFTLAPLREEYGIPLAVMGILVVFMALILVVVFISILPHVLASTAVAEPEEATLVPSLGDDELPEEMVVVIAAAVAAVISKPHRIVKIQGLTPADYGWSLEGRTQQHQSHRIPNRDRR